MTGENDRFCRTLRAVKTVVRPGEEANAPERPTFLQCLGKTYNEPCAAQRARSRGVFLRPRVLLPDVMVATLIETFLPSPMCWHEYVFLEHSLQAGTQH
jgi:hypothetical protein